MVDTPHSQCGGCCSINAVRVRFPLRAPNAPAKFLYRSSVGPPYVLRLACLHLRLYMPASRLVHSLYAATRGVRQIIGGRGRRRGDGIVGATLVVARTTCRARAPGRPSRTANALRSRGRDATRASPTIARRFMALFVHPVASLLVSQSRSQLPQGVDESQRLVQEHMVLRVDDFDHGHLVRDQPHRVVNCGFLTRLAQLAVDDPHGKR